MKHLLAGILFIITAAPTLGAVCEDVEYLDQSFTICEVDPSQDDLRLFLRDSDGAILGSFNAVEREAGRDLVFAMNAGMFHDDRAPVGYYVEDGAEEQRIIPSAGPGNFGMLPNGLLCLNNSTARVVETLTFIEKGMSCESATQSGPLLVWDGELHPRLIPGGRSKFIRNGVGTSADGSRAVFAISNEPVNFHDFATLFRDKLGLPNALYFDGKVSRLFAPALGRDDFGWPMGPIIGVLAPVDENGTSD